LSTTSFPIAPEAYGKHLPPVQVVAEVWPKYLLEIEIEIVVEMAVFFIELGARSEVAIVWAEVNAFVERGRVVHGVASFGLQISLRAEISALVEGVLVRYIELPILPRVGVEQVGFWAPEALISLLLLDHVGVGNPSFPALERQILATLTIIIAIKFFGGAAKDRDTAVWNAFAAWPAIPAQYHPGG
jgi:hypothetical protein